MTIPKTICGFPTIPESGGWREAIYMMDNIIFYRTEAIDEFGELAVKRAMRKLAKEAYKWRKACGE